VSRRNIFFLFHFNEILFFFLSPVALNLLDMIHTRGDSDNDDASESEEEEEEQDEELTNNADVWSSVQSTPSLNNDGEYGAIPNFEGVDRLDSSGENDQRRARRSRAAPLKKMKPKMDAARFTYSAQTRSEVLLADLPVEDVKVREMVAKG
jgi:hypothetical protein